VKKQAKNFPDTNVIVRYLVRDNERFYERAKSFFDKVKDGGEKAIVLESVVAECIYVLTKIYKVPRKKSADSIRDILCYKGIVNGDQKDLVHALTLFSESNLDIVDCILAAKAASGGDKLFTFDEELIRLL
jgi:predicted nucleic acid-binding protein